MSSESVEEKKLDRAVDEKAAVRNVAHVDNAANNINARLANPLEGIPRDQVMADGAAFAKEHGLGHLADEFAKGALIAQDPTSFEGFSELTEADKTILRREITHRWDHPITLYYLVILCSVAACVQGVSLTDLLSISHVALTSRHY
jgi:hypothetical protein